MAAHTSRFLQIWHLLSAPIEDHIVLRSLAPVISASIAAILRLSCPRNICDSDLGGYSPKTAACGSFDAVPQLEAVESGFVIVPAFAGAGLKHAQFVWAWVLAALLSIVVLLMSRLVAERSGRAWRLIRDNELVAPTFGIRPTRYKLGYGSPQFVRFE